MRTKYTIIYRDNETNKRREEVAYSDELCVSIDELALHWGTDHEYVDDITEEEVEEESSHD
jgi:hypothetical protein